MSKTKLITMNLDVKIVHRVLPGYFTVNGMERPWHGYKTAEHMLTVYSQDEKDYLINAGVQTKVPNRPCNLECQYTYVNIDLPYRKQGTNVVKDIAEAAMGRAKEMVQLIPYEGLSIIDVRDTRSTKEFRFKTVIGKIKMPMGPDPGFSRMSVILHPREPPHVENTPPGEASGIPDGEDAVILNRRDDAMEIEEIRRLDLNQD